MVGCDSLNKPYLTMVRYRIHYVNSHRDIYLYLTLIIYFHISDRVKILCVSGVPYPHDRQSLSFVHPAISDNM